MASVEINIRAVFQSAGIDQAGSAIDKTIGKLNNLKVAQDRANEASKARSLEEQRIAQIQQAMATRAGLSDPKRLQAVAKAYREQADAVMELAQAAARLGQMDIARKLMAAGKSAEFTAQKMLRLNQAFDETGKATRRLTREDIYG
jgi:GTP1/Obg family GTP-binding protein